MKFFAGIAFALLTIPMAAQTAPAAGPDAWKALDFLQGTWEAKTDGASGVTSAGTYTFEMVLKKHILMRHGAAKECKGPASFDCDHNDLFYIYEDAPGQPLKAIYFDNEGHVIHYNVTTPSATSVIFLSDGSQPGPQFRLMYELKGAEMLGKFQMRMPGAADWKSYLEWSGSKQTSN